MYKLKVIVASTRAARKGPVVADWFMQIANEYKDTFEIELLDLKEIDLPFLDEPEHPRLQHYRHDHTRKWSKIIDDADAYVIVTCEYNFGYPAPLKNALDYLYKEWNNKPVCFVGYGGIAGGTRAIQMLKQVVTAQKMMPLAEAVYIPFFTRFINEEGIFQGDQTLNTSAHAMMKALIPWTKALKNMRAELS